MTELYIWHHMGMGDYFTCNGIVRHYAEQYDKIVLFYKDPTKENVRRLIMISQIFPLLMVEFMKIIWLNCGK